MKASFTLIIDPLSFFYSLIFLWTNFFLFLTVEVIYTNMFTIMLDLEDSTVKSPGSPKIPVIVSDIG